MSRTAIAKWWSAAVEAQVEITVGAPSVPDHVKVGGRRQVGRGRA